MSSLDNENSEGNRSELLSAAGTLMQVASTIVNGVLARGGNDGMIKNLLKASGSHKLGRIIDTIVGFTVEGPYEGIRLSQDDFYGPLYRSAFPEQKYDYTFANTFDLQGKTTSPHCEMALVSFHEPLYLHEAVRRIQTEVKINNRRVGNATVQHALKFYARYREQVSYARIIVPDSEMEFADTGRKMVMKLDGGRMETWDIKERIEPHTRFLVVRY